MLLGNCLNGLIFLNRRQLVILPGVNSDLSNIFAGIPQGLYTWAITFSYLNKRHCQRCLGSCKRLFADDTSIFIIIENPVSQRKSSKILQWAEIWLVTFNLDEVYSKQSLPFNFYSFELIFGKQIIYFCFFFCGI